MAAILHGRDKAIVAKILDAYRGSDTSRLLVNNVRDQLLVQSMFNFSLSRTMSIY